LVIYVAQVSHRAWGAIKSILPSSAWAVKQAVPEPVQLPQYTGISMDPEFKPVVLRFCHQVKIDKSRSQ
jgi:hypothetical protein